MPDQTPSPVTDEELREAAENGWAPFGARLASELLAARARIAELEAALPYREVWSDETPPGGMVCGTCGYPVESEPCPDHAPKNGEGR